VPALFEPLGYKLGFDSVAASHSGIPGASRQMEHLPHFRLGAGFRVHDHRHDVFNPKFLPPPGEFSL
jgi:hypothetical protein